MYECGQILSRNRFANARRYQSNTTANRQAEYQSKFFSSADFFFPRAPESDPNWGTRGFPHRRYGRSTHYYMCLCAE
jgi:hypothetical protein